ADLSSSFHAAHARLARRRCLWAGTDTKLLLSVCLLKRSRRREPARARCPSALGAAQELRADPRVARRVAAGEPPAARGAAPVAPRLRPRDPLDVAEVLEELEGVAGVDGAQLAQVAFVSHERARVAV